ncbi:WcaI family glycosyltransferase [Paraglaciecola marina]|uniref:WcaI family glycosyltransferase n=1 Tax=Paraglaciecola marina TaxID=2500157 RepID=UPI00105F52C3|nr:WcaI family glycosyltransferase [Paraglaciecola marina]
MKILLTSLNYFPEMTGIGKYNGDFCPELVKRGIDTSVIVAPPYYPEWEVHGGYSSFKFKTELIDGVKVTRCPLYVPKTPTTIKRILHLFSFSLTSSLALLGRLFNKPDLIILVQPTLFCSPFVLMFAKLTGAKTVMHIQDFEVDAMFGLGMVTEGRVIKIIKCVERWLLNKFDAISTISYSMVDNAVEKGVDRDKVLYFPNWSDIHFVTPETCGDNLKKEWGFNHSDKIVLYAGNVGKKQGLEIVLDAAKHLSELSNVYFVIVGAGGHVDVLKKLAREMRLTNLIFKPLQPWERVPEMLALADVHLVIQKKGVADAVLPSKLTNILSAGGHALVTAELSSELGKLSQRFPGIFTCIEPESIDVFVIALNEMLNQKRTTFNSVARTFSEVYLDKDKIINSYISDLGEILA